MLSELEPKSDFHLLNVYLSPIGSDPFLVTMSFIEHGTWPVPTLADVLRDGWLGVQKFERLEEMLASWVSLPSVDYVVRREIREFVVRVVFVVK
jgi:hypothetical protein